MKIITWNVNSVRSRLERLIALLERHSPDVVCLQEIKGGDDVFPRDEIAAAGYRSAVFGQKSYNGVAILSRVEPADVRRGMGDGDDDNAAAEARLISADIEGVRVFSVYVPSGRQVASEHYEHKLRWLARLGRHLERDFSPSEPIALCGDFNVAPDDADVANPTDWADSVLCDAAAREALAGVCGWGLTDVFRRLHPDGGVYSWWDYRRLAFAKNDGLRIDHIWATATLASRCCGASIDRDERKGPKPSDHAPVIAVFR